MAAFGRKIFGGGGDQRTVLCHFMNAGSVVGTITGSRDAKTSSSYLLDSKETPGQTFITFNFAVGGPVFF